MTKAWGIAGLILGILSLFLFLAPYFGLPFAIAAVVFYGVQKKHGPTGPAVGGLVTGIIGIIFNAVMLLLVIGVLALFSAVGPGEVRVAEETLAVSDVEGAVSFEERYLEHLVLHDLAVGKGYGTFDVPGYDLPQATVSGTITNIGNRSVDLVRVTIYFLNDAGERIGEHTYMPVNAYAIIDATTPLRPGYEQDWGFVVESDAPKNWAGEIEVAITDIDFS